MLTLKNKSWTNFELQKQKGVILEGLLREFPVLIVALGEIDVLAGVGVTTCIAHPHIVTSVSQHVTCSLICVI